ncbi:MAG: hypothetical protein MUF54_18790 [Polyangiaceae bacterium]|nr:hypothetical protein [Polyangiaceae bacterium]
MFEPAPPPQRMNVTDTLAPAWQHMTRMLFRPFELGKWFALGLMVFMEMLGQTGGGSFGIPDPGGGGGWPTTEPGGIADAIDKGVRWIGENLGLVLATAIPLTLAGLAMFAVVVWLSARAQLMFARAVATDDANLGRNWRGTAGATKSLFLFRLALEGAVLGLVLGGLGVLFWLAYLLLRRNETDWTVYVMQLGPIVLVWVALLMIPGIVSTLLRSFVVPLMLRLGVPCTDAWRHFARIVRDSVGPLVLFVVLRGLFAIVFGFVNLLVILLTCCIGALPVINQAVTAPYHVFERAWSLLALRSLGPEYDLMAQDESFAAGCHAGPRLPPPSPGGWGRT